MMDCDLIRTEVSEINQHLRHVCKLTSVLFKNVKVVDVMSHLFVWNRLAQLLAFESLLLS